MKANFRLHYILADYLPTSETHYLTGEFRMPKLPTVGIVILNYQRPSDTLECIESLKHRTYPNTNILVVDNGSGGETVNILRRNSVSFQLIETGKNLGYTGGVNVGLRYFLEKHVDYILILNNDTVVEPDFLDHLVAAAELDSDVAACCGTILCNHDRDQIWYAGGKLIPWRGLAVHTDKHKKFIKNNNTKPTRVSFITGCMILLKTKYLEKIGLEDERFFMYLDDIELSARISNSGYKMYFVPDAIIYHKVLGERENPLKLYYSVRNRFLLINTAFSGINKAIANIYFSMVITSKIIYWRIFNPLFFKAAIYGIKDYFSKRFYEGRGIKYFYK